MKSLASLFAVAALGALASASAKDVVVTLQAPVSMRTNAAGRVVADFGRDAFGWLEFLPASAGGDYEVLVGEKLTAAGGVDLKPGGTIHAARIAGNCSTGSVFRVPFAADRRNTTGGEGAAHAVPIPEKFGVVAPFRYVEVVRAPFAPATNTIRRQVLHWPMDLKAGTFACSDVKLTAVWELCKYSIWATSFAGLYVDGDRERIPYEADAYINQLGHYAVEADYTLARRSHEYLLQHPTWPTEWKQHSIMMAWADWMWSGETTSAARAYDRLVAEKLLLDMARPDGLLLTGGERKKGAVKPGWGDIVDWPLGERDGFVFRPVNAVVNAFHYRNLREMADLARALGKAEDAGRFTENAARVRAAFRKVFRLPSGLFADGEGTDHASLHANAAAVAFGLAEANELPALGSFLVEKGMACSVYFAQYYLEALFAAGRDAEAVRFMARDGDRSWYDMIAQGSTITMEAWSLKYKPNQDWNHAWGAAPANLLSRYVLGVEPVRPGFAKFRVKPHLGKLAWARGRVPTPQGLVELDVRPDRLELVVPKGTEASVQYLDREIDFGPGRHTVR